MAITTLLLAQLLQLLVRQYTMHIGDENFAFSRISILSYQALFHVILMCKRVEEIRASNDILYVKLDEKCESFDRKRSEYVLNCRRSRFCWKLTYLTDHNSKNFHNLKYQFHPKHITQNFLYALLRDSTQTVCGFVCRYICFQYRFILFHLDLCRIFSMKYCINTLIQSNIRVHSRVSELDVKAIQLCQNMILGIQLCEALPSLIVMD